MQLNLNLFLRLHWRSVYRQSARPANELHGLLGVGFPSARRQRDGQRVREKGGSPLLMSTRTGGRMDG